MTVTADKSRAYFETTKRLLAQLVNDGLVHGIVDTDGGLGPRLILCRPGGLGQQRERQVTLKLRCSTLLELNGGRLLSIIRPDYLEYPSILRFETGDTSEECNPAKIFDFIQSWFTDMAPEEVMTQIKKELQNSAENQAQWLQVGSLAGRPGLESPSIAWERSLVFGHPRHPFHRTCYALPPLEPTKPANLPQMLTPALAFVSVSRISILEFGPFQTLLKPLLDKLEIEPVDEGQVIVPCLARQLPAVRENFPDAVVLRVIENCADAQANMRTVTLRPELGFEYHMKLSLNAHITSGIRTITRWTAAGGPVLSQVLKDLLPPDLWVYEEVAAVTGSQSDFLAGRQLSCMLRTDLEGRAALNNQVLIVAAAFAEKCLDNGRTYAEILFDLDSIPKKVEWFRSYVQSLFHATLLPLLHHGIGLEAHGQNIVGRVCIKSRHLEGFAVRDFGGIRVHGPTLESQGYVFDEIPQGRTTVTNDLPHIWKKVHHALLQNHAGYLLSALGLEERGGWAIIRDELAAVLKPHEDALGRQIHDYFLQSTMPFTCFMKMKLEKTYRDVIVRDAPNVLLLSSPQLPE